MSRFIPTKRGNPCQICGDTSGKCRETDTDLLLCMSLSDAVEHVPGFRFVGRTKDGLWGQWLPDSAVQADRSEWQQRQQQRQEQREAERRRQIAAELPAAERDKRNRAMLAGLELAAVDRADLEQRGLTAEQIRRWDVRSRNDGYLCPIRDVDGLLVGFQVRRRSAEGGRYRWHQAGGNHVGGELPLAVFRPRAKTLDTIALVEGVGAKPFLASERLGCVAIGASGGQFAASPRTLKRSLDKLSAELGAAAIVLYPDGGAIGNRTTMSLYRKAAELCQGWGYSFQVAWWGQSEKALGDIDEIGVAQLGAIELLSWSQFEAIASPATPQHQAGGDREDWQQQTARIQQELNTLRVQPTIEASGRYIQPDALALPERSGIILIDAPMGTGKTATALKELVRQHRRRHPKALRSLFVPRNQLGLQAGRELGLPHHSEIRGFAVATEVTLCAESIAKLPIDHLPQQPPLVICDEPSQTLKQLLEGKTTGDRQVATLDRLRALLRWVAEQGGWIVLSEDGLTNLELDFIQQAAGLEVVEFLRFQRSDAAPRSYTLYDAPSGTWSEVKNRLSCGESLLAVSDSAKWLRETEQMAIGEGIPQSAVYVLDGESVEEPWAREFAADPDAFVASYKPRLMLLSPTVQSGVSLRDRAGHFAAVAMHFVHLEPRTAKQMPDRLRSDVPRFGYVKERGAGTDALYSNCRPDAILRDLCRNTEGVAKLTDFARYAAEQHQAGDDGAALDILGAMDAVRASKDDPTSGYGFYLRHWANYRAREAYGKLNLRSNLIAIWQQQGHQVELLELGNIKQLAEQRSGIRAELDRAEAVALAAADTSELSPSQARSALQTSGTTAEQRRAARKRLLEDKLPGCDLNNPDWLLKVAVQDDGRFLRAAEMLWLARNPEAAKLIDRWNWLGAFSRAAERQEIVWLPKLSSRSAQAKLLSECPLLPFIEGKTEAWTNDSAEAIAVHQWAVLRRHQLKRYLRLTVEEEHQPVRTVNKLLRQLGYEVAQNGWVGRTRQAKGQRLYRIANLEDADRDAILAALTERFLKRCESKASDAQSETVIATRIEISTPTSCDHELADWLTQESLADVRSMWQMAEDEAARAELRRIVPHDVLRRAIA